MSTPPRGRAYRDVIGPLHRASQRAGVYAVAQRLAEVRRWMDDDLNALHALLQQQSHSDSEADTAQRAARHLLLRPGKRIRPLCTLLSARLLDIDVDGTIHELALCSELVHAATLLHDDVIDEGERRRGVPAARMVYGNSASILGGDYLLVEALARVTRACRDGQLAPLRSMLDTIGQMVAGEAIQLEMRHAFTPDRKRYLQVVDGKTASLFRWALCAPALLDNNRHAGTLAEVGSALGLAFQLIDDALDFADSSDSSGKDLLADLSQGKATWPVIIACERIPTLMGEIAAAAHTHPKGAAATTASLVEQIRSSGGIEETYAFAEEQHQRALMALSQLPGTPARAALHAVIDAAIHRAA